MYSFPWRSSWSCGVRQSKLTGNSDFCPRMENNTPKTKRQLRRERLRHQYRLVVMNNDTFEEVGSYQLTLLNLYVWGSVLLLCLVLLVGSLIVFTPLRRYIPGYGDVSVQPKLVQLNRELDSLQARLAYHEGYTDNFRKILVGDVEGFAESDEDEGGAVDSLLESPSRIAEDEALRREIEQEELRLRNRANTSGDPGITGVPLDQMPFLSPLNGETSASFDPRNQHFGIDVIAPKNKEIKAALDGFVIQSDWTRETGKTLGIQHPNNVITFYKHNSVLLKNVGDRVQAGEAVAIIGNTGEQTDGPHLHFELWYEGQPVDPAAYIRFD